MGKTISLSTGFTLIELLFSITIFLIILGAFYEINSFIYRDYSRQIALTESAQEARVAISLFQNEIQNSGLDPNGTAFKGSLSKGEVPFNCVKKPEIAEPVMEASETVFHFMGDRYPKEKKKDDDGNLIPEWVRYQDRNEDVRYEWVGKEGVDSCKKPRTPYTLYRNTGSGQQEVALGIEKFRLDYFDENGTRLPKGFLGQEDRRKIRKVVLTLKTLKRRNTKQGNHEWISEIYLKNLG